MSSATTSIKVFGVYVVVTGVGLTFAPALLLGTLGIAAPAEIWVRVLGVLSLVVGYYYLACAAANAVAFFRASVTGRIAFAVLMGVLVVAFSAPWQLLLFAAIDVAGAAWTALGLQAANRRGA